MSRKDKKMTVFQLTNMVKSNAELITITNTRIDFMAEAVMGDLERFNMLMMSILEEHGHISKKNCLQGDCDAEFSWIDVGGRLPEPDMCPDCNRASIEASMLEEEE
jgi:hypothetical protein